MTRVTRMTRAVLIGAMGMAGALQPGCQSKKEKAPVTLTVANPRLGAMTVAVAPALNLSGSADFDRNRFADLMASELSYADGISVIPVSRVLAVLAAQGRENIDSPTHAAEVAAWVGADAILVFAVTEYDPYDPPSIGISAQLYAPRPGPGVGTVSANTGGEIERSATPADGTARARIIAETTGVIDATHESVVADVRQFAQGRTADDSPYGWRRFLVSQQAYIRFCCHVTVRNLLRGSTADIAGLQSPG